MRLAVLLFSYSNFRPKCSEPPETADSVSLDVGRLDLTAQPPHQSTVLVDQATALQ